MENKKITKEQFLHGLSYVPFPILILVIASCFALGILAIVYASVSYMAFESAMIFLIIFGCAILSAGIGLLLIDCFNKYAKKLSNKEDETKENTEPATTTIVEKKKSKLNFQTVCLGVIAIGAVFVLISAGLGSISPDNWRTEIGEYCNSKGYNAQAQRYEVSYYNPVDKITIDLHSKNVVVLYTNDDCVTIRGYETFPGQMTTTYGNGMLKITDNSAPSIEDDNVAKMMFFLFEENEAESQIRVIIPISQKENIEIIGDYVIAQE